ncbi:sensor histidine kinase [Chitinophaga nivalis]|uniref:Histidine kinase n=1 Tax=Chitinophaga nivalis TaxID=2991709 RepID=A0ABT3IK14_9BACT|nr:histidine kinase [Chitinophaga nivalis]MCW3466012.1 histidine kinase [Chitinophaga nivalis]MCW3484297.1 histidine kinase [Chitinophaga nivalis]
MNSAYSISSKQKKIGYHILFWVCYTLLNHFITFSRHNGHAYIQDSIGQYLVAALIFYCNTNYTLPVFFARKRYRAFALAVILLSFFSFGIKLILYLKILPLFGLPAMSDSLPSLYLMNSWWWYQYTLWGFGYWFVKTTLAREREKSLLVNENMAAEYAYLKAQINPHFLYNVLNFFYARALNLSAELADGILNLADIMRYIINNEGNELKRIPLYKEIEQINNVIRIHQLRFNQELKVTFIAEDDYTHVKINPFILITLVENAFKHRELLHSKSLVIKLNYDPCIALLQLFISHEKTIVPHTPPADVGMEDLRRRLQLIYKEKYHLFVQDDHQHYEINLSIYL